MGVPVRKMMMWPEISHVKCWSLNSCHKGFPLLEGGALWGLVCEYLEDLQRKEAVTEDNVGDLGVQDVS
uniref:Uncharacterized protein n=1 Tax=Nelumbo nucifera TaxID=4432 RepID=A0A822ZEF2_NELNU|nr:TPA_asm: hypothetical protein HUJ06_001742 [Nelumbo nucifera]